MATELRVLVLGSGGSLDGGRLARSGVDVTLVDVREYHSRPCGRTDCVSTSATPRPTEEWGAGDGSGSVDVAAITDTGSVPDVDLVIAFDTSTATATAVADAAES